MCKNASKAKNIRVEFLESCLAGMLKDLRLGVTTEFVEEVTVNGD